LKRNLGKSDKIWAKSKSCLYPQIIDLLRLFCMRYDFGEKQNNDLIYCSTLALKPPSCKYS